MAAAACLAGCKSKINNGGEGTMSLELNYGGDYVVRQTKAAVDVADFQIKLVRNDGWTKEFPRYADMPMTLNLGSGHYTITAVSGIAAPAAFDQPVYGGSTEFDIKVGQTTPVQLTCTLTNMKVTIVPTANFLAELSAYSVTVSNGEATLVWNTEDVANGQKAGYFTVAPLHVHVDGYRAIDGSQASYDGDILNVAARDHHIISLDARVTGTIGGFELIVDYSTNDKNDDVYVPGFDEIPVPGPDDPDDPDDPEPGPGPEPEYTLTLSWPENPTYERTELKSDMGDVRMSVVAELGIKKFLVKITSPAAGFMAAVGAMATYMEDDVAVLDLTDAETYSGDKNMKGVLGLTPDTLVGETEVEFNLGGLLPLIIAVGQLGPDDIGSIHTFTMDLTDSEDHVFVQPLEFEYKGN